MRKIILVFLLFLLVISLKVGAAGAVSPEEYTLFSPDKEVTVTFNAKFGGAITKIFDLVNMPGLNLINDNQAGAMFQNAFWTLPYHSWVDSTKPVPPDCSPTRNDMRLNNPTQAGYVGDGLAGNPIGILGTNNDTTEPEEFIRYEDNNKTIHFKTKFIRYDYCQSLAPLSTSQCDTKAQNSYLAKLPAYYNLPPEQVYFNGSSVPTCRDLWDTNFYLEQWASFHPTLPRVLVLKSKISYTGQIPAKITTRQLPVIFAFWLTKGVYWENGQKVEVTNPGAVNTNPDQNWVALLSQAKDAGIGMVTNPRMQAMLNRKKFQFELQTELGFNNEPMAALSAGSGVSDLRLDGLLTKVTLEGDHLFVFENGGTYETVSYYPIGTLDMIKQSSEEILNDRSSFPHPPINILDLRHFLSNFLQSLTIFDYNKMVENFGK